MTRFQHPPDAGAHANDAVTLVVTAIRKSGLNRARLRDAIQALSPYQGVSGTIEWDPSAATPARPDSHP